MLIFGPASVIKIYKGSKNSFAYTMTAYTCVFGLAFVAMGALGFPSGEWSYYAFEAFVYLYYWLSVQGWIFAIQYFESSVKSGETTCISEKLVKWLKWTVAVSYSVILLIGLVIE